MQFPAWKPVELLQGCRGFEREKKLAQLVSHHGRHPFGVAVFVKQYCAAGPLCGALTMV
jgi:hypothetical protein